MNTLAYRYHDISSGHRVCGHDSGCQHLHGHNYRVHLWCRAAKLDKLGMVIDFKVMKSTLCEYLENTWDHRFLIWHDDPWADTLKRLDPEGVLLVPFNPTAEHMAAHLLSVVGPRLLAPLKVELVKVQIDETRKCSASAEI